MNDHTESLNTILAATRTLLEIIRFMPESGLTGNMTHEIQRIIQAVGDIANH